MDKPSKSTIIPKFNSSTSQTLTQQTSNTLQPQQYFNTDYSLIPSHQPSYEIFPLSTPPQRLIPDPPQQQYFNTNSSQRKDSLTISNELKQLEDEKQKTSTSSSSDTFEIHGLDMLQNSCSEIAQEMPQDIRQSVNPNIYKIVYGFHYENYSYEQLKNLVDQLSAKQIDLKISKLESLITNMLITCAASIEFFGKLQDYEPGAPVFILENLAGPLSNENLCFLTTMLLNKYINLLNSDTFEFRTDLADAIQYKIKLLNTVETYVISFLRKFKNKLNNSTTLITIYKLIELCMKPNEQYLLLSPKVAGNLLKDYGEQFNNNQSKNKNDKIKKKSSFKGSIFKKRNKSCSTPTNKKPEERTLKIEQLSSILDLQTAIEQFGTTLNQGDSVLIVECLKEISKNQDSYNAFLTLSNSFLLKYLAKINVKHDKLLQPILILTNLAQYMDEKGLKDMAPGVIKKYFGILQNDCPLGITQNIVTYLANFLYAHKNKIGNKILLEYLNTLIGICMLRTEGCFNYLPGASKILTEFHNELQLHKP